MEFETWDYLALKPTSQIMQGSLTFTRGIGFNTEEAEGKEVEWGENRLGKALMRARKRLGGK